MFCISISILKFCLYSCTPASASLGELQRSLGQGQGELPEHPLLPQPRVPKLLLPVPEPAGLPESPGGRAVQLPAQGSNAGRGVPCLGQEYSVQWQCPRSQGLRDLPDPPGLSAGNGNHVANL